MKFTKLALISSIQFCALLGISQNIKVQPYLQDAFPTSMNILWETDFMDESIVNWGLTNSLGNTAIGTADSTSGTARVHDVKIENLQPFTKYFYSVTTGTATSPVYTFKTPPLPSSNHPFRIISMSDMQKDGFQPTKFSEIIHDGIIDYLDDEYGGDMIDNLALVMIPGDLVPNGLNYNQWETTFFSPSEDLFSHIPVYPVPGNHENNAPFFYKYFRLPDNGTAGFEEHWWYKDYENVRIIGLDSNNPFSNQEQLDWLNALLDSTCTNDDIDFVFAQLHHPHKSELWTPGESNYTGDVIDLLEQFSTDCGKPSIHFFGHTHAYSRGDSRDHKHVWLNTASAGGAIDNWGEFPNADYDEFSVSQDDYGFVTVDVTADSDPKITIKRISRGDQITIIDNALTDSLVVHKNPSIVNIPVPLFPVNVEVIPDCFILDADLFNSPNATAEHGQSHWQISDNATDFSAPVKESWKKFENWYFEANTQANDDLSDEKFENLNENSSYWWRVRYRDKELNWSDWTSATPFTTGPAVSLPNLILNQGAENGMTDWTITLGIAESLNALQCAGINPYIGSKYFAIGGLCDHSDTGIVVQNIDVTSYAAMIDAASLPVNFGGHLSDYGGVDLPEMRILFYDVNSTLIGTSNTLSTLNNTWTYLSETQMIPALTRTIQVELKGTRNGGTDNDSYFDEVFLTVGDQPIDCATNTASLSENQPYIKALKIFPNPIMDIGNIELPEGDYVNAQFFVVDMTGKKIKVHFEINEQILKFKKTT